MKGFSRQQTQRVGSGGDEGGMECATDNHIGFNSHDTTFNTDIVVLRCTANSLFDVLTM